MEVRVAALISGILSLATIFTFFLPWMSISYEGGTQSITVNIDTTPVTITVSHDDYTAPISGLGAGNCKLTGPLTMSSPYGTLYGTYKLNVDYTYSFWFINILSLVSMLIASLLILAVALQASPKANRPLGYSSLIFLMLGMVLSICYLASIWSHIGDMKVKMRMYVNISGYTYYTRGEEDMSMDEFLEDANSIIPSYGFVLFSIIWVISLILLAVEKPWSFRPTAISSIHRLTLPNHS